MKNLHVLLIFFLVLSGNMLGQSTVLELKPEQGMCITGKGPGQDGAINKYQNNDCIATVKNLAVNSFDVRIQKKGRVIEIVTIAQGETKEVNLKKGHEMYLDSTLKAKAEVAFRPVAY